MPEVAVHRISSSAEPLIVIDGFAADPDALRAASIGAAFGPAGHHYPGVRAPLPAGYLRDQLPVIAAAVAQAVGRDCALEVVDASFSIVTTSPAELTIQQRAGTYPPTRRSAERPGTNSPLVRGETNALDVRLCEADRRFVVRGLVKNWPLVAAGQRSASDARVYRRTRSRPAVRGVGHRSPCRGSWVQVMLGQGITPRSHQPIAAKLRDEELERLLSSIRDQVKRTVSGLPEHAAYVSDYCGAPHPASQSGVFAA